MELLARQEECGAWKGNPQDSYGFGRRVLMRDSAGTRSTSSRSHCDLVISSFLFFLNPAQIAGKLLRI